MPSYVRAKELRDKRRGLAEQAAALLPDDPSAMTAEARAQWEAIHQDIDQLNTTIESVERQMDLDAEILESDARSQRSRGVVAGRPDTSGDEDDDGDRSQGPDAERRARNDWYRFGWSGLEDDQRSLLQLPGSEETRGLVAGQDSAGGILLPREQPQPIVSARKAHATFRRAGAQVLGTSHGRALPIPTDDDTSAEGRLLGEGKTDRERDVKFGEVILGAHWYGSGLVKVSDDLMTDSEMDIDSFLLQRFILRIERSFNRHLTVRKGTGGPVGVLQQVVVGHTAAAADVSYDDLVMLEHSVDAAYRDGAKLMMNDATLGRLKMLKDANGNPLWLPSLAIGAPDRLLNYEYTTNNFMPEIASGKRTILFGNFSSIWVREVNPPVVKRFTELYGRERQVGFEMFQRLDGRYVNAGTHPIKALVHA